MNDKMPKEPAESSPSLVLMIPCDVGLLAEFVAPSSASAIVAIELYPIDLSKRDI